MTNATMHIVASCIDHNSDDAPRPPLRAEHSNPTHKKNLSIYIPLTDPSLDSSPFPFTKKHSPSSSQSSSSSIELEKYFDDLQRSSPLKALSEKALENQDVTYAGAAPSHQDSLLRWLDSPTAWLFYYFLINLGLTLYNKLVLVKFPFPWTMTAIHCLSSTLGCLCLQQQGYFTVASINTREHLTLFLYSALYALNIAISNVSLNLASIPFHQVIRATTPLFTIGINAIFFGKLESPKVILSLAPVVLGVGFATYGDYAFTAFGFYLTIFGALLASLKGVATSILLVGPLRLHPLDLLLRMSPMAFLQCLLYAYFGGEFHDMQTSGAFQLTYERGMSLGLNGLLAFLLNVVSFSTNKKTSALTMTVAGNVKQCLTILLAVWLFHLYITETNALGILLTLFGGAWYAREKHRQRSRVASTAL